MCEHTVAPSAPILAHSLVTVSHRLREALVLSLGMG